MKKNALVEAYNEHSSYVTRLVLQGYRYTLVSLAKTDTKS